jgi:hypothetical protein
MQIYWVDSDRPKSLAMAPRPRGGDWLDAASNSEKSEEALPVRTLLERPTPCGDYLYAIAALDAPAR